MQPGPLSTGKPPSLELLLFHVFITNFELLDCTAATDIALESYLVSRLKRQIDELESKKKNRTEHEHF